MRNKQFMIYLLGIFISTIILIVYLQYNSGSHINKLITGNESLINEFQIIGETQKLQTDMLYIESEIHRSVIGEDSGYLESIQNKEKNVRASLSNLIPLVPDSTKRLVQQLDSLINEKLKFDNNILNTLFTKGHSAAVEMYKRREGKDEMGEIVNAINLLNSPRSQYLTQLAIEADKSGYRAKQWGIFLAITAVLACILTFLYITKRIKRQQQLFDQLNESEKKLREAGIMKENFMANMSHEIRTPMNAILGFTHLLQKQTLNDVSKGYINSIQRSSENLLTIINDILDFSKIEAGMMRIEVNPFSLRGLLHSLETMFIEKAKEKKLLLSVIAEDSIPDTLNGDAIRLTQVFVNLVGNAIKFTPAGSILIEAKNQNQSDDVIQICFSVKDTGIGIPQNKIGDIFERFSQVDGDITRKFGGTGLGLSIVKQLVELQNGSITIKSTEHVGTEVSFMIPYRIIRQELLQQDTKYEPLPETYLQRENISILVAEDNTMNQTLMKHLLSDWKMDFHIVSNGAEAIEALQKKPYDLILMDIQMPQMDGYTATQKIRNDLHNTIPVVAMTAHAMAGEREKCLSYGINEYISKPIREKELYKIINELIRKNNNTSEKIIHSVSGSNERQYSNTDLQYLDELSGGNIDFKKTMISQFIAQVPDELNQLEAFLERKDYLSAKQTAHNLKTSVSFLGLTDKLESPLNYIEDRILIEKDSLLIAEAISSVKKICANAMQEAKIYLSRL